MNIKEDIFGDNTRGGGERPPCTGFTPGVFPEVQKPVWAENLQTGVSTRYALQGSVPKTDEGDSKKFLIGTRSVPRMDAKGEHTIIWLESA